MLDRHGVPERQRLKTLETAVEMSYQQVRRRMTGESPWGVDEVKRLASHFGEPLLGLLATLVGDVGQRATLHLAGMAVPCMIWLGALAPTKSRAGPLVAVAGESAESWSVVSTAEAGERPAYEIKRLILEAAPPRRVAIIDDDPTLAAGIVKFLCEKGLQAISYRTGASLLVALETSRFDGFVLDWMAGAANIVDILPAVRARSPGAPIIILTKRVKAGGAAEDELESALSVYRAQLYEKPTRMLSLFTALHLGFEPNAHSS